MKSYLRYEPKKSYGVIASPQCNVTYDCSGNLAISGALQEISLWNLRQANLVAKQLSSEYRTAKYIYAALKDYAVTMYNSVIATCGNMQASHHPVDVAVENVFESCERLQQIS